MIDLGHITFFLNWGVGVGVDKRNMGTIYVGFIKSTTICDIVPSTTPQVLHPLEQLGAALLSITYRVQ